MTGLAVVAGYGLLGATWLIMRTTGPRPRPRTQDWRPLLLLTVLLGMAIVSLWTPFSVPRIAERWFSLPNFYFLWPVPTLWQSIALLIWRWLTSGHDALPFFGTIGLFLLGYAGLVISTVPYLVPPHLTFWDTAAAPASQIFLLIGTLFLLPMILGYTIFVYWIFRGRIVLARATTDVPEPVEPGCRPSRSFHRRKA